MNPPTASSAERVKFYPTLGASEQVDPLVPGDLLLRILHRTLVGGPGTCIVTVLQLLLGVAGWVLKTEESRCRGQTHVRLGRSSEISELMFASPQGVAVGEAVTVSDVMDVKHLPRSGHPPASAPHTLLPERHLGSNLAVEGG